MSRALLLVLVLGTLGCSLFLYFQYFADPPPFHLYAVAPPLPTFPDKTYCGDAAICLVDLPPPPGTRVNQSMTFAGGGGGIFMARSWDIRCIAVTVDQGGKGTVSPTNDCPSLVIQ